MRLTVVGGGYVGLVSGVCLAEIGHEVIVVEVIPEKVEMLRNGLVPIHEPGLDALMASNVQAGRLSFTGSIDAAVAGSEVVFIAVGTPTRPDGHADLSYVFAAAEQVAKAAATPIVLVTKSTVPVGTGVQVLDLVRRVRPDLAIDVASNPEFLREGNALGDFMNPDRIVVGTRGGLALDVLRRVYAPMAGANLQTLSVETAELAKYAANAFLATKVGFINEVADLCEVTGADVQQVATAMGLDHRIGAPFLKAGPGYGGSCFPKDTLALVRTGQELGKPLRIVEATIAANDARKAGLAGRIAAACGGSVDGKVIAVLGLAFKAGTDDMRDAPALDLLPALIEAGALIQAFDPEAMVNAARLLPAAMECCPSALRAATGADALVVLTEWPEFRDLPVDALYAAMRDHVVVDLRNIWSPATMRGAGFRYTSVGRA